MPDREKVMKGLKQHLIVPDGEDCVDCPYGGEMDGLDCVRQLYADAMELLNKREPYVLTLSEIESSEVIWFEVRTSLYVEPMLTRGKPFADASAYWFKYGRDWRCWSARPTDEQRKAVKWDAID